MVLNSHESNLCFPVRFVIKQFMFFLSRYICSKYLMNRTFKITSPVVIDIFRYKRRDDMYRFLKPLNIYELEGRKFNGTIFLYFLGDVIIIMLWQNGGNPLYDSS